GLTLSVPSSEEIQPARRAIREGAIVTKIDELNAPYQHPLRLPFCERKSFLNSHRHYNTAVPFLRGASDDSGAQSVLEFEHDLLVLDGPDRVQQIPRIEADRDLLPGIVDVQGFLRLPHVLAGCGHPEGGRRQGHLDRLVALL